MISSSPMSAKRSVSLPPRNAAYIREDVDMSVRECDFDAALDDILREDERINAELQRNTSKSNKKGKERNKSRKRSQKKRSKPKSLTEKDLDDTVHKLTFMNDFTNTANSMNWYTPDSRQTTETLFSVFADHGWLDAIHDKRQETEIGNEFSTGRNIQSEDVGKKEELLIMEDIPYKYFRGSSDLNPVFAGSQIPKTLQESERRSGLNNPDDVITKKEELVMMEEIEYNKCQGTQEAYKISSPASEKQILQSEAVRAEAKLAVMTEFQDSTFKANQDREQTVPSNNAEIYFSIYQGRQTMGDSIYVEREDVQSSSCQDENSMKGTMRLRQPRPSKGMHEIKDPKFCNEEKVNLSSDKESNESVAILSQTKRSIQPCSNSETKSIETSLSAEQMQLRSNHGTQELKPIISTKMKQIQLGPNYLMTADTKQNSCLILFLLTLEAEMPGTFYENLVKSSNISSLLKSIVCKTEMIDQLLEDYC